MQKTVPIRPGVVFWPKVTGQTKPHPWVVLGISEDNRALVANLSDVDHNPDAECIIYKNEHPDFTKDCYINFAKARTFNSRNMSKELSKGTAVVHCQDLSPELLDRVLKVARASDYISDYVKFEFGLKQPPSTEVPF
jgi:hypothetical protein